MTDMNSDSDNEFIDLLRDSIRQSMTLIDTNAGSWEGMLKTTTAVDGEFTASPLCAAFSIGWAMTVIAALDVIYEFRGDEPISDDMRRTSIVPLADVIATEVIDSLVREHNTVLLEEN